MLFRPGMTRSGARQPGAVRSLNSHERQVFGPPTNGSSEPPAVTHCDGPEKLTQINCVADAPATGPRSQGPASSPNPSHHHHRCC